MLARNVVAYRATRFEDENLTLQAETVCWPEQKRRNARSSFKSSSWPRNKHVLVKLIAGLHVNAFRTSAT